MKSDIARPDPLIVLDKLLYNHQLEFYKNYLYLEAYDIALKRDF